MRFIEIKETHEDLSCLRLRFIGVFSNERVRFPSPTLHFSTLFSLNDLPLRYSSADSDSHKGFNFESSVHPSIIDASKGIATVISFYLLGKS